MSSTEKELKTNSPKEVDTKLQQPPLDNISPQTSDGSGLGAKQKLMGDIPDDPILSKLTNPYESVTLPPPQIDPFSKSVIESATDLQPDEPAQSDQIDSFSESVTEPEPHYNTAKIRELMINCYSYEELIAISFDKLGEVYNEFSPSMGKYQIIQLLLDYARRRSMERMLLLALKEEHPSCYSRYEAAIGNPWQITRDKKTIVVNISDAEITKEGIDGIVKSITVELEIPLAEARSVYIQPKITLVVSLPNQKADKLQQFQQGQLEILRTKYDLEKIEVVDSSIKLSSSSDALTDTAIDKFKLEIADMLGILPQEIRFDYNKSTLFTIALPGEKADLLLKLDQEGKLEEWKKSLGIKQLKPENNLDRYVQLVATLTPSAKTSLLKKADGLRRNIAGALRADWKQIRLPTWESRSIKFLLVLPAQVATKLKTDSLQDLDILRLKTIYVRKDKEVILATLVSKIDEGNGNVTYSRNDLAQNFSFEIAKKLRIEPGEVEISWLSDCASFSFVLPSRFAAILLYHHSTGKLKNFLDFEIQDLHIGQYDWDNYLGLVPVTS